MAISLMHVYGDLSNLITKLGNTTAMIVMSMREKNAIDVLMKEDVNRIEYRISIGYHH